VCFLTVKMLNVKKLDDLIKEAKKVILQCGGKRKVLTDPKQALTTTDPYTGEKLKKGPSYVVKDCLVSLRFWYSMFEGPAVSCIIVGPPKNALQLKDLLMPLFSTYFNKGRACSDPEKFTVSDKVFDCPKGNWLEKYLYAEVLAKDLREGALQLKSYSGSTLWDEVKESTITGERLSGEPEILHEIEDIMRIGGSFANRSQIKKVLEAVPYIFPENWVSPESFNDLTSAQKIIYTQLANLGVCHLTGLEIQKIIETALQYKVHGAEA